MLIFLLLFPFLRMHADIDPLEVSGDFQTANRFFVQIIGGNVIGPTLDAGVVPGSGESPSLRRLF